MDEPINKKSILFLFLILLMIFVFIYKGLVLSGDEYLEEYLKYKRFNGKTTSPSGLKRGKGENFPKHNELSYVNRTELIYELSNVDDNILQLKSLSHKIKNKNEKLIDDLNKLVSSNQTNGLQDAINEVNNIQKDYHSLQTNLDDLYQKIEKLRNISTN